MATNRTKTCVALWLTLVMMLTLWTGLAVAEEKPVITMLALVDGNIPDENNVVKRAIEEQFGVTLMIEKNGSETAHYDKLNLLLTANDLPDIIVGFKVADAKSAGMKGMLLPLNAYQELMPNFYEWMTKDAKTLNNLLAGDGNLYSAPRYDLFLRVNRVPQLRVDLLEALGLEIPTTFDGLYEALKAVKAAYPDNLGMYSNNGYQDLTSCWGFYFNTAIGYGTTSGMFYDRYQDKWVYGPTNEGYLELVTYFNKLWSEGLMDPEYFTTTSSTNKATMGNVFVTSNTDDAAWKMELQHQKAYPDSPLNYEIVVPFQSESMPELAVSMRQHVNAGWSWSVSADTEYPELCAQIIDWLYTEDGSYKATAGYEGEHYNFAEQNGNTVWKYVPEISREYNPEGTLEPRATFNLRHPFWVRLNRDYYGEYQADDAYILQHNATLEAMYSLPGYERNNDNIELTFSDEQYDEMNQIVLNLQTIVDETTHQFIMGQKPLEEYPAFLEEMAQYGSTRLEEIYADAYALWKAQTE